jgi:thiol:disulfide interchange protein/DsbC/DsbD-like thiol-disulfide interchange protein
MFKAIIVLLFAGLSFAAEEHATVSLQRHQNLLVVTINHDSGWHTYWKNPGDSGLPSEFILKPASTKAHEWPIPTRHMEAGDILTIGYGGKQHFFFDDVQGDVDAHIKMLICKDICIPGEAKLKIKANEKFVASRSTSLYSTSELNEAFEKLPKPAEKPANLEFYLTRVKDQNALTLHYSLKGAKSAKLTHELNFLTAFPQAPFGFKRETIYHKDDTLYGKLEIDWDGEYMDPPLALPANGNFPKAYELKFLLNSPQKSGVDVITLPIKDYSAATAALDDFYQSLGGEQKIASADVPKMEGGIFHYLFFAFIGGLILNLMPCVLPVISLKLFGLIKHRDISRSRLLRHNLTYTAGVLATFMALAGIVATIKATGEEIGWGFQLQSPAFILVMMLILFVLSLNLFGVFEFATPGGSKLGNSQTEEGLVGDFFSGVLTTILATPCSAPFLGTALTFAFTESHFTIFLMFFSIGLGLAFPFLLTAILPASLKLFPRPGMWMEKLKYFLGLSLIVTTIWLYDVFVSLVNFDAISWRLNLLFALWFFAFFFAKKISQHILLRGLTFALPLVLTVMAIQNLELRPTSLGVVKTETNWIPWTEEKMKAETKPVFVDFTAEWCLTCKVNKKLVLETRGFEDLKAKYGLVTMRADWTRRDDNITEFLRMNGSVGVPFYILMKDGKAIPLGETVSLSKIEKHLL